MLKPLFNPNDDQWVMMVGRYMLNMGAMEAAARQLIVLINETDSIPIFNDSLAPKIGYLKKRFPRDDLPKHKTAMNTFNVAAKHVKFRNIIAHNPLAFREGLDRSLDIQGIMNMAPDDKKILYELISLEELSGRVNESAIVVRQLLEMQSELSNQAQS